MEGFPRLRLRASFFSGVVSWPTDIASEGAGASGDGGFFVRSGSVRASASSLMGVGGRRRREVGGRVVASASFLTEVGGGRRVRPLMGSAVSGKGTTVGDGGDGLARSKGRRFSLRHPKMVSTGGMLVYACLRVMKRH